MGLPVVSLPEGYWHSSCFTCRVCRENVRSEFHIVDDLLLCPEHYELRRGAFCKGCYGQLTDTEVTAAHRNGTAGNQWLELNFFLFQFLFCKTGADVQVRQDARGLRRVSGLQGPRPRRYAARTLTTRLRILTSAFYQNKIGEAAVVDQSRKAYFHQGCITCQVCGQVSAF